MLGLSLPWWLPLGRVPEINAATLKSWLEEGRRLQLCDARTGLEYHQGTIGVPASGPARHAPLTDMPASLARLHLDPSLPVVMLCLSGHRSLPGTRWLRARGYQAYSLQGGLLAWKAAGYPLLLPD